MLKRTSRPSSDERRARILIAAAPLFDEKGLDRTLTRDIAAAAGVSEALLYKHFPTKEAIYAAIRSQYAELVQDEELLAIEKMKPSAKKLAIMIAVMSRRHLTGGRSPGVGTPSERTRVFLNSLADAGQYARTSLLDWVKEGYPRVEACLSAAEAAGDCNVGASYQAVSLHIELVLRMQAALHTSQNDDLYETPTAQLVRDTVRFCMRGLGFTPAAIERTLEPAMTFDAKYWKQPTPKVNAGTTSKKKVARIG